MCISGGAYFRRFLFQLSFGLDHLQILLNISGMATRVYVGGLSHRCRERDIEKFFRKYGKLREISMKNGYAFVEFDDYRDADDAVYECNGRDMMGDR